VLVLGLWLRGILHFHSQNLVGMDWRRHGIACDFERVSFGLLHQVGDRGASCAFGHVKLDVAGLPFPLINTEDESVVVLSLFQRR